MSVNCRENSCKCSTNNDYNNNKDNNNDTIATPPTN